MNKQQLANRIWASANKMRSKIEASEYKDYILGLIFYKFLSDNEVNYLKKNAGWTDEDLPALRENYENEEDKYVINFCQENIGYFIEYKHLFSTWLLPDSDFSASELNVALGSFDRLINPAFEHVYKGIFDTLQAGMQKLGESPAVQTRALNDLIRLIKDIPTDGKQDYDVLGYVYEYLIANFAANAGKKAGEFYTPQEVAKLMSEIVAWHLRDRKELSIYDPTSGSGSLEITIGKAVGKHLEDTDKVVYYAQELKENTYNLTRMNLVMHGIKPANIITRCADSLAEDWPVEDPNTVSSDPLCVDAVVSNPPYSQHWDPTDADMDPRFKDYGVAPKSKADYAFLLHELHHLKAHGIMTIVLPHGVLFRGTPDDGAEGQIRQKLIERNNIDTIIGLPANIFYGTGIPTLIMVLKQQRSKDDDDVLFIDASKGFIKDGTRNKLRECDIKKIADTVRDRKEIPGFSRRVSRQTIRENNYNLNIPRYVDSSEQAESYDIYATMFGGIPVKEIDTLDKYWKVFPSLRNELFEQDGSKPYAKMKTDDVTTTIRKNKDVQEHELAFNKAFNGFGDFLHQKLITHVETVKELTAQDEIADEIFDRISPLPLEGDGDGRYEAYQALADEWQTIANDIEIIQQEGKDACRAIDEATKLVGDEEVFDGYRGRIFPFELIQHEMFQDELDKIASMQEELEGLNAELSEIQESFTDDEQSAYLEEQDNTKLNKKAIKADAKTKDGSVEPETLEKLKRIVEIWEKQPKVRKAIKGAEEDLQNKTIDAIRNLSDEQIDRLLHKKWIDPICNGINNTLVKLLSDLESSVVELVKKYAISFQSLNEEESATESELAKLTNELTGDDFAVDGLLALFKN